MVVIFRFFFRRRRGRIEQVLDGDGLDAFARPVVVVDDGVDGRWFLLVIVRGSSGQQSVAFALELDPARVAERLAVDARAPLTCLLGLAAVALAQILADGRGKLTAAVARARGRAVNACRHRNVRWLRVYRAGEARRCTEVKRGEIRWAR